MGVNVYKEEQTDEVLVSHQKAKTGTEYVGVSFLLVSPTELHNTESDDDRSAVTFWGSSCGDLAELLSRALKKLEE